MAEDREVFLRARNRTFTSFNEDVESEWKEPFYFIQGADPQFGLMKSWAIGESDFGGDEWEEEIKLTEEAVDAINKLCPKPKFFVLCGDLVHAMPDRGVGDRDQAIGNELLAMQASLHALLANAANLLPVF